MNFPSVIVWLAGLVLQTLLLIVVVRRGLAGRLWTFTLLLVFYIARALFLYFLFGHVGPRRYGAYYDLTSAMDIVLRILLVAEIGIRLVRTDTAELAGTTKTAFLLLSGIVLAAAVAAALASGGTASLQRGSTFVSLVMVCLLPSLFASALGRFPRRVAEGFAVFGVLSIAADAGRSQAVVQRSRVGWAAAGYIESGIWLLVLVFWISAFLSETEASAEQADAAEKPKQNTVVSQH